MFLINITLKNVFIFCFLVCFTPFVSSSQYRKNEEVQVLKDAKKKNFPIIAVFLGKQGCPWSQKLQDEVLENIQFHQKIGDEVVLWQVELFGKEEERELREKYQIQVSPLILLLDPQGKEFARLEYIPLDAAGYADEIHSLIEGFQEVCLALESDERVFEEEKWQNLYSKSSRFSAPCFRQIILERGVQLEKGTFFHIEKYADMLEKSKRKHPQVKLAKKWLLECDPENHYGTHFKVAVLEFHSLLKKLKNKDRLTKPVKPLLQFVQNFRHKDKDNLWKAELMIANYLFSKNLVSQALSHAKISYDAAPDADKPQVVEAISYMKRKI